MLEDRHPSLGRKYRTAAGALALGVDDLPAAVGSSDACTTGISGNGPARRAGERARPGLHDRQGQNRFHSFRSGRRLSRPEQRSVSAGAAGFARLGSAGSVRLPMRRRRRSGEAFDPAFNAAARADWRGARLAGKRLRKGQSLSGTAFAASGLSEDMSGRESARWQFGEGN
jgi:hypothetical protein